MSKTGKDDLRALVTNIQGFSTEDGPGIRSTVFFKGCPLKCPWCHNPEGLSSKPDLIFYAEKCIGCKECLGVCNEGAPVPGGPGHENCVKCFECVEACPSTARQKMGECYTVDELLKQVLKDRVFYETSDGGVTASGGEAMLWWRFLTEFFKELKAEEIHTALDTSGVIGGEALDSVLAYTDLTLVDLKIMDPEKHKELIGVELEPVLKNIGRIDSSDRPVIIRTPVVPGYTDSTENLNAIADFVSGLESVEWVDLLPYHRMAEAKYRQLGIEYAVADISPPDDEVMSRAQKIFTDKGIKAVIAGKE